MEEKDFRHRRQTAMGRGEKVTAATEFRKKFFFLLS
jgi:hypothetical protein